jgi:hypothetical protein
VSLWQDYITLGGSVELGELLHCQMTTNVTLIGHHLAAFLNSQQEGCVALGVDEDGTVHGLVMDRESRDLFSRELSVLMHELRTFPDVDFEIDFVQVKGEAGDMPNLFVPRIRLHALEGRSDVLFQGNLYRRVGGMTVLDLNR